MKLSYKIKKAVKDYGLPHTPEQTARKFNLPIVAVRAMLSIKKVRKPGSGLKIFGNDLK